MVNELDVMSLRDMKDRPDMMLKQQTPVDFDILTAGTTTSGDWTSIVPLSLGTSVVITTISGARNLDALVGKWPSGAAIIARVSRIVIPSGSTTVILAYKRVV